MEQKAKVPLLVEIEQVFPLYGQNPDEVAVVGILIRGEVNIGEDVEIVGITPHVKQVKLVNAFTKFHSPFYILKGIPKQDVYSGQVLASPGTMLPNTAFVADIIFDERHEKIRQQPDQGRIKYLLHIRRTDVFATLHFPPNQDEIRHGDHVTVKIVLHRPIALEVGLHFGIGRFLGQGTVTNILE